MNKIKEFNPVIYPIRLWVANNVPIKQIINKFYVRTDSGEASDFLEEDFNKNNGVTASTYVVFDKKTKQGGTLVYIFQPKRAKINIICHESAHCADFVCQTFGLSRGNYEQGEAYAYLIGWIAECVESVVKNKKLNKNLTFS